MEVDGVEEEEESRSSIVDISKCQNNCAEHYERGRRVLVYVDESERDNNKVNQRYCVAKVAE